MENVWQLNVPRKPCNTAAHDWTVTSRAVIRNWVKWKQSFSSQCSPAKGTDTAKSPRKGKPSTTGDILWGAHWGQTPANSYSLLWTALRHMQLAINMDFSFKTSRKAIRSLSFTGTTALGLGLRLLNSYWDTSPYCAALKYKWQDFSFLYAAFSSQLLCFLCPIGLSTCPPHPSWLSIQRKGSAGREIK